MKGLGFEFGIPGRFRGLGIRRLDFGFRAP